MAGWQEELAELLRELGVTQEESQTHLRSTGKPTRSDSQGRLYAEKPARHMADAFISDDVGLDDEVWLTDLGMMRREVDVIVQQVIALMQRGDLSPTLKDDVMIVLRALRRRSTVTRQAAAGDAAYIESVAAMLHFCRLVLCLSETSIEDM